MTDKIKRITKKTERGYNNLSLSVFYYMNIIKWQMNKEMNKRFI